MANNFLEQLVAEWYEYKGYFVRRNVPVGRRARGGYESELDVVAFNPTLRHLVHVEPSLTAESWEKRERLFRTKFEAGKKYIPDLFDGFDVPPDIEQIAILVFASKSNHPTLGGGKVLLISDLMRQIMEDLGDKKLISNPVPEHHTILRTLQFVIEYRKKVFDTLR
ncbi:MAG: hypothetical protein K0R53_606 [Burkholderiales bacterium]|jgi:hypothetical protein|nr:hypothetical protein [Burkholderiales bacterium]